MVSEGLEGVERGTPKWIPLVSVIIMGIVRLAGSWVLFANGKPCGFPAGKALDPYPHALPTATASCVSRPHRRRRKVQLAVRRGRAYP